MFIAIIEEKSQTVSGVFRHYNGKQLSKIPRVFKIGSDA